MAILSKVRSTVNKYEVKRENVNGLFSTLIYIIMEQTLNWVENKYHRWYFSIIKKRINTPPIDNYTESHHIHPKCLGGTDIDTNIVKLSAREHYICHLLLTKMFTVNTKEYFKMFHAFAAMCWQKSWNTQYRDYKINSRLFERFKIEYSRILSFNQTGHLNNNYGKKWYFNEHTKQNKTFKENEAPFGWTVGRVINWEKYFKSKDSRKPKSSFEVFCKNCYNHFFTKRNSKLFCSYDCKRSFEWNKSPKMITVERSGVLKTIKRQNLNAYKVTGWKLKDRLY